MIQVEKKERIQSSLTPKVFKKMLCLPSANKILKLPDVDTFLDSQVGGSNVLKDFLIPSTNMSSDLSM
jgi:hypothetical protein